MSKLINLNSHPSKCLFISFVCFSIGCGHFLMTFGCFLFIREIFPLSIIWVPKAVPNGVSLLFLCIIVLEYSVFLPEKVLYPLLCWSGEAVWLGQWNVSRSMFVTSGLKLKLPGLCTFSLCHGNWHGNGYAFSWGTQCEGDNSGDKGVEALAYLQLNM